jgi:hypothetical protein
MYYGQVLDMLAQHHPEYVSLAWGTLKFILMVRGNLCLMTIWLSLPFVAQLIEH